MRLEEEGTSHLTAEDAEDRRVKTEIVRVPLPSLRWFGVRGLTPTALRAAIATRLQTKIIALRFNDLKPTLTTVRHATSQGGEALFFLKSET